MVGLGPVVGVRLGSVPRRWEQLLQHDRVGRCSVGDDLHRHYLRRADGPPEEPVGRHVVTPRGDEYVNDLAELVGPGMARLPQLQSGRWSAAISPPPGPTTAGIRAS